MVMEDEGKKLPEASDYAMAYEKADKKVQDDSDRLDYTKGIITMVVVDVSEYRKKWKFENSRFHTKKMKGFSV